MSTAEGRLQGHAARYPYLDWVRIIGTLSVFIYHSGRAYNLEDWHIKNSQLSLGLHIWLEFIIQWLMPVMFVVSGMSSYLALRNRSGGRFLWDRVLRLMVPLLFVGIFVLSPPQVYIERVTHGMFSGSFLEFYSHLFDGLYLGVGQGGYFPWMGVHLWYLLLLFLLTLILLPLFVYLKRDRVKESLSKLTFFDRPGAIFLLAIPLALLGMLVGEEGIGARMLGGWSAVLYLAFFAYGYLLLAIPSLGRAAQKHGIPALIGGVLITAVGVPLVMNDIDIGLIPGETLRAFNSWFWVLAIIGLCARYLDLENRFSKYANEAVLPFYMLHQPVIILVVWLLLSWDAGPILKYLAVLVIGFPSIAILYEFGIRRFNVVRFLFGLKPLPPVSRRQPAPVAGR
jgi:hypothetical protein